MDCGVETGNESHHGEDEDDGREVLEVCRVSVGLRPLVDGVAQVADSSRHHDNRE